MQQDITLPELARRCRISPSWLRTKVQREGVQTYLGHVRTEQGLRRVRWVPGDYAAKLIRRYLEAQQKAEAMRS